jgi:hypothetical protein
MLCIKCQNRNFIQFAAFLIASLLLSSCLSTLATPTPDRFTVQYTPSSSAWLAALEKCAGSNLVSVEQRTTSFLDPDSVDLVIQIGMFGIQPPHAYPIGKDDLVVILNPKNPIKTLTKAQVLSLFNGQIAGWQELKGSNALVQVWAFNSGDDIQQVFDQSILGGSLVVSTARLANGPSEMLTAVANDTNAIGIINRRLKTNEVSEAFTAASNLPVLAITSTEPNGTLSGILACMQK